MKVIKGLIEETYELIGKEVPRTKKGNVKTDADTLKESCNLDLMELAGWSANQKLMGTFIEGVLEQGAKHSLHPAYDVLKATGRTSSYGGMKLSDGSKLGFNVQQLPRKGGVRECFVPRKGYVYIGADYSTLELCCLAQVTYTLFGESAMREAINSGQDLHMVTGASILGHGPLSAWQWD